MKALLYPFSHKSKFETGWWCFFKPGSSLLRPHHGTVMGADVELEEAVSSEVDDGAVARARRAVERAFP